MQEAITVALRTWRRDGVPPNPAGWLAITARRRAIDLLRRRTRESQLADELAEDPTVGVAADRPGDERLPMLFGCCHPALGVEARLALTLRAVVGMSTPQIARAFLVPEATMAQRLVRAKRKITQAGIPFAIPELDELAPRLDDVLTVVYLSYNAGYLDPSAAGRELTEDAVWLAELVARAMPEQPEAWGLLALLTFLSSRTPARFDDAEGWCCWRSRTGPAGMRWRSPGRTGIWSRRRRCAGRVGTSCRRRWPAVHSSAATWAQTDWLQIVIAVRHARPAGRLAGGPAEPGDRDEPACAGPRRRWRRSRRWPIGWTAITCSTPPGPSCSSGWATTRRRGPRTSGRSR